MATTEEFEQAYRNMLVASARLHVAEMFARFEARLIMELSAAVDRGDLRLVDVLGYVPGANHVQAETTFRVEWGHEDDKGPNRSDLHLH